jgi:hypothetical protein
VRAVRVASALAAFVGAMVWVVLLGLAAKEGGVEWDFEQ